MDNRHTKYSSNWRRLFERDVTYVVLILVYLFLQTWQKNWYPAERFHEWDNYWCDVLTCGRMVTIERALRNVEIPAVDPYTGFGFNHTGDLYSPWNPTYLLALVLSPRAVIHVSEFIYLALAGIGAFFFLRRFTSDKFISLLAALAYVSTWNLYCTLYYFPRTWSYFLVPFILLAIHGVLERPTAWRMVCFALVSAVAIGGTDTFALFLVPAIVFTYALMVAWRYYSMPLLGSLKKAVILLCLGLLASSMYIVPFYWNCRTISDTLDLFRVIPGAVASKGAWLYPFGFFEAMKLWGANLEYSVIPARSCPRSIICLRTTFSVH